MSGTDSSHLGEEDAPRMADALSDTCAITNDKTPHEGARTFAALKKVRIRMADTLTRGAPRKKKEHKMNNSAPKPEPTVPDVPIETIERARSRVSDAEWRRYTDKQYVALQIQPPMIIGGSNDYSVFVPANGHTPASVFITEPTSPFVVVPSKYYAAAGSACNG
jgi:hypothetical protein